MWWFQTPTSAPSFSPARLPSMRAAAGWRGRETVAHDRLRRTIQSADQPTSILGCDGDVWSSVTSRGTPAFRESAAGL